MPRIVAAHPTIEARLLIHLKQVLTTEQGAFIGSVALGLRDSALPDVHSFEDD